MVEAPLALSAFDLELERLERAVARPVDGPMSASGASELGSALYRRATLTGSWPHMDEAASVVEDLLGRVGPWPDLCYLRAQIDLALHRPAAALEALRRAPGLAQSRLGRGLAVDAALQEGRYEAAMAEAAALADGGGGSDDLARLAHVRALDGDLDHADELYAAAEDELSAKELRGYAWLELERSCLQFARGRIGQASAHVARADRAYSGWWVVRVHLARIRRAQVRPAEAAALYEQVLARVDRPELEQALGSVYAQLGRAEAAEARYERALAGYVESVAHGAVHYLHHLTDFYAEVRGDGVEAERWARRDLALRPTDSAHAALARALQLQGRHAEALAALEPALASRVADPGLSARAAAIRAAGGE